jgi:hypothetical protein
MSTPIVKLLDAAKTITGSDYKTAQLLGVGRAKLSDWRAGRGAKPQPEDHALLAAIAGLDPEEHLVRAVLEKHQNSPKGEKLRSALGNGLRAIGEAAIWAFFASAGCLGLTRPSEASTLPRLEPTHDNV